MSDDLHLAIGEANGKLDMLIRLMREHVEQDDRRFGLVDVELRSHAKDINQAKGAKGALLLVAGGLAGFVSIAVAAAAKLFGGH